MALNVTEVLGHGQCRERNTQAHSWRLIHLTEDQRCTVEHRDSGFDVDHGLAHLDEEVSTFTGTLPHTGEHRHATELAGHAVDHLGDEHGLAHTSATE